MQLLKCITELDGLWGFIALFPIASIVSIIGGWLYCKSQVRGLDCKFLFQTSRSEVIPNKLVIHIANHTGTEIDIQSAFVHFSDGSLAHVISAGNSPTGAFRIKFRDTNQPSFLSMDKVLIKHGGSTETFLALDNQLTYEQFASKLTPSLIQKFFFCRRNYLELVIQERGKNAKPETMRATIKNVLEFPMDITPKGNTEILTFDSTSSPGTFDVRLDDESSNGPTLRAELARSGKSSFQFRVENCSQHKVSDIGFTIIPPSADNPLVESDCKRKLPFPLLLPGQSFTLIAALHLQSSMSYHVQLTWRNPDGSKGTEDQYLTL